MFVNIVGVYLNLKNHSLVHFSCSTASDIETQICHVTRGLGNFKGPAHAVLDAPRRIDNQWYNHLYTVPNYIGNNSNNVGDVSQYISKHFGAFLAYFTMKF